MKVEVTCPCGRQYYVPNDHVGRKIQCKKCGQVLTVEAEEAEPAPFSMAFVSMEDTGLPNRTFNFDIDDDDDDESEESDYGDSEPLMPSNIGLMPSDSEVADFASPAQPLARKTDRAPVFQEPLPLPKRSSKSRSESKKTKRRSKKKKKKQSGAYDRPPGDIALGFDTPASEELLPDFTKNCPSCQTVCPSDVRICISCGYDFERRELVVKEAPTANPSRHAAQQAKTFASSLERLSWASLIPFVGLVLGPLTLIRSAGASAHSRQLSKKAEHHFKQTVVQSRLVAVIATIIWAAVSFFAVSHFLKDKDPELARRRNRSELRTLGNAVASFVRKHKVFPKNANNSNDAIDELSPYLEQLSSDALKTKYKGRFSEKINSETPSSRWLFWEIVPHQEKSKDVHSIVRLDQSIEKVNAENFSDELKKAFQFKAVKPKTTPKVKRFGDEQQLKSFLEYFAKTQGKTKLVDLETVVKQSGIRFLSDKISDDDLRIRAIALNCIERITDIPEVERKRLFVSAYNLGDDDDKLRIIKILKKSKDQDWLRFAGKLYKGTSNELIKPTLYKFLLEQYRESDISIRALLNVAVDLRKTAEERPLLSPPNEEIKKLIPLLANSSYFDEILSVFNLATDLDLAPEIIAAIKAETETESKLLMLKALLSIYLSVPENAVKVASEVLNDNRIESSTRIEILRQLMRVDHPLIIRFAAEQYTKDRSALATIVREIFQASINRPNYLPELIKTFDTEASSITKEAMSREINDQLTQSIALTATDIKNKRGILAILTLIRGRPDAGSLSLLKTFNKHKDPVILAEVFNSIRRIKTDPLNEELGEFIGNYAADALKERGRNDSKTVFLCKQLGIYQRSSNISILRTFATRTTSLSAANAAITAIGEYNSMNAVKALLAIIKQKRVKRSVQSKATTELRGLANIRVKTNSLEDYVRSNRSSIIKVLGRKETARLRRINR